MSTVAATSPPKTSGKRKRVAHSNIPSADILNAMTVEYARKLYQKLASRATSVGKCLIPNVKLCHGDYPRYKLNAEDVEALTPELQNRIKEVRSSKAKKKAKAQEKTQLTIPKLRVPYHHIAWRATGEQVPKFESGQDISHTCRRGQVRLPNVPEKERRRVSVSTLKTRFGCFNCECLECVDHKDNLNRGGCVPILRCPHCTLFFNNCEHETPCGTAPALEEGLRLQKEVKSITVKYTDGSKNTLIVPIAKPKTSFVTSPSPSSPSSDEKEDEDEDEEGDENAEESM